MYVNVRGVPLQLLGNWANLLLCKSCGDIRQNINIKLNLKNVANEQATIEQQLLLLFLIVITMYYGRGGLHKLKFHFWSTKKVNCATFPQNSFPQAQHGEWQSSVARSLSTLPFSPSISHTLPPPVLCLCAHPNAGPSSFLHTWLHFAAILLRLACTYKFSVVMRRATLSLSW